MKYYFKLKIILLFIFSIAVSCEQEKSSDVQQINDFKTLGEKFLSPPAEFTTAPFFVWDGVITKEETERFLKEFSENGIKQVFIHPRPGLVTEYLSDEWFSNFRYAVDKGKELGMKVWIYDENSYPSGFAGGHVPAEMPESYNQGQGLKMEKREMLPDTLDSYFIILKGENGSYENITASAASHKGTKGSFLLFTKTYFGKSDWHGGFSYVDLLYPGVTQKFIEITMKGYEKVAGEEFGKTIPGTFTDEPEIVSPGGIRFTPDLFAVFSKQWGYDLVTSLPSLYEETGDWKKVRHNYTQTLLDLFIERWAKPWYEYCEAKGFAFTGHYWEHEWPNMRPGGDNMAMYTWHQVPAIDMLFNQWDDSSHKAQFGNVRAIKELASAANQSGRLRKLSETYGGSGWELTFTDMKRNGDWEYALGVNLMNQHLTYYTMAGARKYDYPPSFDYHEPWWDKYKMMNDHYTRLSLALSSGRQVNDILILEPTTSCWLYDSYAARNKTVADIGQTFQTFITQLEKEQVEYDLGSEKILDEMGSVKNGKLTVGHASYSTVIIPPKTENLNEITFSLLKKFVKQGGTLYLCSKPSLLDGKESEELAGFMNGKNSRIVEVSWPGDITELKNLEGSVKFTGIDGGELYHQTRMTDDGKIVFLVNSSLSSDLKSTFVCKGGSVSELNSFTGEIRPYTFSSGNDSVTVEFELPPAGSLLLYVHNATAESPARKVTEITDTIAVTGGITAKRLSENMIMIDFCDLTVGKESFRDLHTYTATDKVFKHHGFVNGNPWNTSVQYRRNIVDRDTFGPGTGFSVQYRFKVKGKPSVEGTRLVVERAAQWKVELNGKEIKPIEGEWWLDRSFGVFPAEGVKEGENTVTVTMSPMKISGEIEPIYLLGDFSVEPAEKGWTVRWPSTVLATGNWVTQGLPFYSGEVSYSAEFDLEKKGGSYTLMTGEWKGTVAELSVNGKPAGIIAFPPYTADITDFLTEGKNKIEFVITGSLRNLLGPHHRNPPEGLSSPWHWRYVEKYPAGKDYKLYDYGLSGGINILHSSELN